MMTIDVVIPTFKRPDNTKNLLTSILHQTVKPQKVIVVDDSPDSRTEQLIIGLRHTFLESGVTLVHKYGAGPDRKGICRARNLGMDETISEVVLFADDDVVLDIRYIEQLLATYEKHPEASGVQGYNGYKYRQPSYSLNKLFMLYYGEKARTRVLNSTGLTWAYSVEDVIECEWMTGTNSSYRRKVINEFRWDNKLGSYSLYDDVDFSCRVLKKYPHSLFLTPFARFVHNPSKSARRKRKLDTFIRFSYPLYFFKKDIKSTFRNWLEFLWSMIGRLWIGFPWTEYPLQLYHMLNAYVFVLKNYKHILKGEFKFLADDK